MSNTRNVKFNFSDDGSLDKLRTQYDTFASKLVQNSKNFAFNNGGNQNSQQNKYIRDEVDYYKQAWEYQKKIFDEKKKQYDLLTQERRLNDENKRKGTITDAEYNRRASLLNREERGLLAGSGKRKWSTYEAQQTGQIADTQNYTNRLERLLEGSNLLLRQILSQEKQDALNTIEAIENDENSTLEQQMAASQARQTIESKKDPKDKDKNSIVKDLFTYQNLNSLLKNATGIFTANSGEDAAKNLMQSGKEAALSIIDIGADVAENFLGKKTGKIVSTLLRVGGRAAGAFVDVSQDDMFSAYDNRQNLERINNQNRALTGNSLDNFSLSKSGFSLIDFASANTNIARSMGYGRGSEGQTRNALQLERGFGVGQDISATLLELARTNKETDRNLISIVGGIYNSGQNIFKGDRTYLGEFITKNFINLQRQLLTNRTSVASGTVMDILNRFNSVGGQFDARNPNSQGLISSINGALMNPSGDSMDALTFAALRKSMPGASIGDILREREKGLGSSKYLDATMSQLSQMGGSDDYQMINLSKAFGINYNASTDLLNKYKKNPNLFKNISQDQLQGVIGGLDGMAEANTNQVDTHAAELTDAKILGDFEKMTTLISQISDIIDKSFNGATYSIDPATGKLTVAMGASKNQIKKPTTPANTPPAKQPVMTFGGGFTNP
jgi:hypothetical protein